MRQFPNTAPAPAQQPETPLHAAGYHLTPSRIGVQRVKAYTAALAGLAAIYASRRAAIALDQPAVILLGLAIAGGCAIYAWSIIEGIRDVRRTLWHHETDSGRDIDGDGHIGPPPSPVGRILRIGGQQQQEVIMPDLDPPPDRRPLAGFPADPPVTPNDVVFVISNAAADGLSFRTWSKRRLPSGAEITSGPSGRDLWTGILDGLLAWQFATASTTTDGRRTVTLRSDVDLETMLQAIKTSVETPARVES